MKHLAHFLVREEMSCADMIEQEQEQEFLIEEQTRELCEESLLFKSMKEIEEYN